MRCCDGHSTEAQTDRCCAYGKHVIRDRNWWFTWVKLDVSLVGVPSDQHAATDWRATSGWHPRLNRISRCRERNYGNRVKCTEKERRETHVCVCVCVCRLCAKSMRYWNIHRSTRGGRGGCICVSRSVKAFVPASTRYLRPWVTVILPRRAPPFVATRSRHVASRFPRSRMDRSIWPCNHVCVLGDQLRPERVRVASPRDRQPRTERARGVATLTRPDDVGLPAPPTLLTTWTRGPSVLSRHFDRRLIHRENAVEFSNQRTRSRYTDGGGSCYIVT